MTTEITVTPSWREVLMPLLAVAQYGTAEGRHLAIKELERMATAADRWSDYCRVRPLEPRAVR